MGQHEKPPGIGAQIFSSRCPATRASHLGVTLYLTHSQMVVKQGCSLTMQPVDLVSLVVRSMFVFEVGEFVRSRFLLEEESLCVLLGLEYAEGRSKTVRSRTAGGAKAG